MCYCHLIILWHFYCCLFSVWRILLGTVSLHTFINFTENSICISPFAVALLFEILNPGLRAPLQNYVQEGKFHPNNFYLHPVEGSDMLQWFYPPEGLNGELLIFFIFTTPWRAGQEQLNYPRIPFFSYKIVFKFRVREVCLII